MKNKFLIYLMIFLSLGSIVTAKKINEADSWIYTDSNGTEFNETAISTIENATITDNPVRAIKVETNRSLPFDMNFNRINTIDILYHSEGLYITQEGALPFVAYNMTFDHVIINNESKTVKSYDWLSMYDPSENLIDTSLGVYSIGIQMFFNTSGYIEMLMEWKHYEIVSDSNANDKIKNFTVSLIDQEYSYTDMSNMSKSFHYNTADNLHMNNKITMMKLSYDIDISQPIVIEQLASNISTLSLLEDNWIVYTLKTNISQEKTSFFFFYASIVLLIFPIIKKNKNLKF